MKELKLKLCQLNLNLFSKEKNSINNVIFDFDVQDLKNQNIGKKIIKLCDDFKRQGINYNIVNSLPKCIFAPEDNLQAEQLGLLKSCFDCNKLFRVSYFNQVEFCNVEKAKFIDDYKDRGELFSDFIKSHNNHQIPDICNDCFQKTSCSYGCLFRKNNFIPFGTKKDLLDYSVKRNTEFFKKEKHFQNSRIFCFPSYTCNNDCLYCFVEDKNKIENPTFEFLKNMIEENCKKFSIINFGGGEPTLYKYILELIRLAKQKKLKVQMFSNGRRFADRKFAKNILDAGIDVITEVFHSFKPEVHDFITQRKGSFNQMLKGIENLHSLGFFNLHAMVVVHKQNYSDLRKLVEFLILLKIKIITFEALVLSGRAVKNFHSLAVQFDDIVPFVQDALDLLIEKKNNFKLASFPLCLFNQKYWKYFCNHRYALSSINFFTMISPDQPIIKTDGLRLGTKCIDCQLKKFCPGTWNPYFYFFGEDEFQPQQFSAEKSLLLRPREIIEELQNLRQKLLTKRHSMDMII